MTRLGYSRDVLEIPVPRAVHVRVGRVVAMLYLWPGDWSWPRRDGWPHDWREQNARAGRTIYRGPIVRYVLLGPLDLRRHR